jgi:esterase/lipase superfamily enzyme
MVLPNAIRAGKHVAVLALCLSLAGCFSLGSGGSAGSEAFASINNDPVLLVATTRRPAENLSQSPFFGPERGRGLSFARARMTPPSRSIAGRVASVVTGGWRVDRVEDLTQTDAAAAFSRAAIGQDVLLYVHGYRESFETAATSAAELAEGIGFRGAPAIFTWPSGAATFDYGYDRESAMWSRDAFEDLLVALAQTSSAGRMHIVAHSMGSQVTLETLRLVRAAGGDAAMSRIGAVVLASPDVDIDLFEQAVRRLGTDAGKITVITSSKDRALRVSQRIAGGVARAGSADRDQLVKLGVRVADASDFGGGLINHDLFLSNAEVRAVVKRSVERER